MSSLFGGSWTNEKLEILGRYLNAYTTALKSQPFQLTYVDAFAGEGTYLANSDYVSEDYEDLQEFRAGSPRIALEVQDKPFDRLVFVEKDPARCASLRLLEREFPNRNIGIRNEDANSALPAFCATLGNSERAVVFLDPFATQVSWSTVEKLARTQKIDCWILFPLMAIARMMPMTRIPPDSLAAQLDRAFGGRQYWEEFYSESPQQQLPWFSDKPTQERLQGSDQIALRYRERLESEFARVAPTPRTFRNSKNSPMFELFFAASNPRGAIRAVPIADHILKHW